MLASTYIAEEHRVRDASLPGGVKIMTFAHLLKYSAYPLANILSELLKLGKDGMGGEVELEFALQLDPEPEKSVFYFLQVRPMITGGEMADVQICDHETKDSVLLCQPVSWSRQFLEYGRYHLCQSGCL